MKTKTLQLMQEAFDLLGVHTFLDLSNAYSHEDQKLMKSQEWDAYNPILITNKVKAILEQMDPNELEASDRDWWNEILWFWYHHATSCELLRSMAQKYATKALEHQTKDHPNRLTRLLWHLAYDRVDQAKKWMADAPPDADPVEHQNGLDLISEYQERKFWINL